MNEYETPKATIISFITQQSIAGDSWYKPALVDDGLSLEETPDFTEGVGDW